MSTKTPECWANDPNAQGVIIERSAEQSLLLPFDQFAFAELTRDGKEQQLRLIFATHEVSICGHSLNRIETIMQRKQLSRLTTLPSHQRSMIADGQPVISEIVVTEADSKQKRTENVSGSLQ